MKLRKCPNNHYTLKDTCPQCNQQTKDAHYKFIKLKDAKETQPQQLLKTKRSA